MILRVQVRKQMPSLHFAHPLKIPWELLVEQLDLWHLAPQLCPTKPVQQSQVQYSYTQTLHVCHIIWHTYYIDPSNHPNVGIYGIHGVSGIYNRLGLSYYL